jgi:BirA family transcriptional regulator, biotin operon repressor / biotin---[acetyl-CoA-carboxylase] ligase
MKRADVKVIGSKVLSLTVVDSTNSYLQRELTSGLLREGLVVNAQQQTKGKGQRGSEWFSLMGQNILMSVLLYPDFLAADKQFYLSMAVASATAEFVQDLLPEKLVQVKWPNDILVEGKKVGGILIENSIQGSILKNSIVGIGLNANWNPPEKTSRPSASLRDFGCKRSPSELLPELCEYLDEKYSELKAGNYSQLKEEYLDMLFGFGKERQFTDLGKGEDFTGSVAGVDDYGRLQIDTATGQKRFGIKEIAF